MPTMFQVNTDAGLRVHDGNGHGMPEDQAIASVKDRNDRAEALDIATRYVVADYVAKPE